MTMQRNLSNLGEDCDAELALNKIVEVFGENYLERNQTGRLPKLWRRNDRLATVELYTLGVCLMKIQEHNRDWLKGTVRRIKKEPPSSSHGFFTELFYAGVFDLQYSQIEPAANSQPGYDFMATLPNNSKQFISIKNIDISEAQKQFQRNCRKLRRRWLEILKIAKVSLGIKISSSTHLTDEDFVNLAEKLASLDLTKIAQDIIVDDKWHFSINRILSGQDKLSPQCISDFLQVFCPPAKSEYSRYVSKVRMAIKNIIQHTDNNNDDISRVIFIRMHVSADFDYIAEEVKLQMNKPDNKIDCIICYQPSYVRDKENASLLHHCFLIDVTPNYALKMDYTDIFKVKIPLGIYSFSSSPLVVFDLVNGNKTELPPNFYCFQRGDIYLEPFKDYDGSFVIKNIGSPAPGIKKYAVVAGKVIENKATAHIEELQII